MGNKLLKNLVNKPDEFKPGQVWFLVKDTNEYPSMEIVLTDTQYVDNIGIVRGAALTAVKNGGDGHDVILNKKHYAETLPSGRVCLRFTDCALPKHRLEFFIDELNKNDWKRVKKSLHIKESSHIEPQLKLAGSLIERLSLFRNEAVDIYEHWLETINNKDRAIKLLAILSLISKRKKIQSYYLLTSTNLDDTISLDKLWGLVKENRDKTINLYEDKNLIVDFMVLNKLPHLIFYSNVRSKIELVKLIKGNIIARATDEKFSIRKNEKFITTLDPSQLNAGDWTLSFTINNKEKNIFVRIK